MKKLISLSALLVILILCSFGFQQNHIKKIGAGLYSTDKIFSKQLSAEDKATLHKLIREKYNIKDFTKNVTISKDNPINKKGGCMVQAMYQTIIFDNRSLYFTKENSIDAGAREMNVIMAKYAR